MYCSNIVMMHNGNNIVNKEQDKEQDMVDTRKIEQETITVKTIEKEKVGRKLDIAGWSTFVEGINNYWLDGVMFCQIGNYCC